MSVEIAWKQNILVTDFHLLKSLLVVFGFGSQAFVCGFSRQNINSALEQVDLECRKSQFNTQTTFKDWLKIQFECPHEGKSNQVHETLLFFVQDLPLSNYCQNFLRSTIIVHIQTQQSHNLNSRAWLLCIEPILSVSWTL